MINHKKKYLYLPSIQILHLIRFLNEKCLIRIYKKISEILPWKKKWFIIMTRGDTLTIDYVFHKALNYVTVDTRIKSECVQECTTHDSYSFR